LKLHNEAVSVGERYRNNWREWARLGLHAAKDTRAYTELLASTVAATLQPSRDRFVLSQ
jgi:hypothetical protein